MCVLILAQEMISKRDAVLISLENADGIGIAYRHENKLYFDRNITIPHLMEIGNLYQPPYMIHFRAASSGGNNRNKLCHPFPISDELDALDGTSELVLAHNGHWVNADSVAKQFGLKINKSWSDTKVMAFISNYLQDHTWLGELDNQKIAVMNLTEFVRYGRGWYHDSDSGNYYSNIKWSKELRKSHKCLPAHYTSKTTLQLGEKPKTGVIQLPACVPNSTGFKNFDTIGTDQEYFERLSIGSGLA